MAPSRSSRPSRAPDGSLQLTDEKRLELIEKAFRDCGEKPTRELVEKQFFYETGRKPK